MSVVRLNVNIKGMGRILERVRRIESNAPEVRKKVSREMAEYLQKAVIVKLSSTSGGGQTWNPDNPHWQKWWSNIYDNSSSRPGNPPVFQQGRLSNLSSFEIRETGAGNATFEVTNPVGLFLEFGYTSWKGNPVHPRPFVRPAAEESATEFYLIAARGGKDLIS